MIISHSAREIVVNAADNKQRDASMSFLKIEIDQEKNRLSVMNDGKGIPVCMHKEHNVYVPELIFGHLLAGSNFNDDKKKTADIKKSTISHEHLQ